MLLYMYFIRISFMYYVTNKNESAYGKEIDIERHARVYSLV